MRRFEGDETKNARIRIDYSGVKPDVTFSYPAKSYQFTGSMFPELVFYGVILFVIVYYFLDLYGLHDSDPVVYAAQLISLILICTIIIPSFLYIPFRKQWKNIYPKYQAWKAKKKYTYFYPKDVKHTEEYGWYCEIPVFKNVILNYRATKDFSKNLRFFEIEEHKFSYYQGFDKIPAKASPKEKARKKKKRKRKRLNEWIWYARFYFKEKPKSGRLFVLFK